MTEKPKTPDPLEELRAYDPRTYALVMGRAPRPCTVVNSRGPHAVCLLARHGDRGWTYLGYALYDGLKQQWRYGSWIQPRTLKQVLEELYPRTTNTTEHVPSLKTILDVATDLDTDTADTPDELDTPNAIRALTLLAAGLAKHVHRQQIQIDDLTAAVHHLKDRPAAAAPD